jgi:hypothetical protein
MLTDVSILVTILTVSSEDCDLRHFIQDIVQGAIASGAQQGRLVLSRLIAQTEPRGVPTVAYLDFDGIEVATSSFLRESVVGFKEYCRKQQPSIYPVVANAGDAVREELQFFLKSQGDAMWACALTSDGAWSQAGVLGRASLDPGQLEAFDAVCARKGKTATELKNQADGPDSNIGVTGWNNRLAALSMRGLVIEHKVGKAKSFTAVLETT